MESRGCAFIRCSKKYCAYPLLSLEMSVESRLKLVGWIANQLINPRGVPSAAVSSSCTTSSLTDEPNAAASLFAS